MASASVVQQLNPRRYRKMEAAVCFGRTVMLEVCTRSSRVALILLFNSLIPEISALQESWSDWTPCSATCGYGQRIRFRKHAYYFDKETSPCIIKYCPSYLGWPRIHFSGHLMADVNTVNNIRCAYDNPEFYPSQLSKQYIGLEKLHGTHVSYKFATSNWNPDGTNQIYFVDTNVTSFCVGPTTCDHGGLIVGLPVRESKRGVMSVVDVDWQMATEIWGLEVSIPGVLKGTYLPASHQDIKDRFDATTYNQSRGYGLPSMSRYKSKLSNLTWYDTYYKSQFGGAAELSMIFTYDFFDQISLMGRITGTIGKTSNDDPVQTIAGRKFQVYGISKSDFVGSAPFHIHGKQKTVSVDFGLSVRGLVDGSITSDGLGQLDLAVMLRICPDCRKRQWTRITRNGLISSLITDTKVWYKTYGGIINIDISHLDQSMISELHKSRIGILNEKGAVYMAEFPYGMNYGFMERSIFRLNVGEAVSTHVFVSSYGKPVRNAQVSLYRVVGEEASAICSLKHCNNSLGIPSAAIGLSSDHGIILTNQSGIATVAISAVSDPGNIRGCGLDGQLYPLHIFVRYRRGKRTRSYSSGVSPTTGRVKCTAEHRTHTFSICARIYNCVPEKKCPVWNDVKDVFLQYYNLYPVMWKYGIIDLHSYDDIRKHSRMLYKAMFQTDFSDARYMPMSRDLSGGNSMLIKNWIKCGMVKKEVAINDRCTHSALKKGTEEVQRLLQHAIMFELATIPIYMSAWFSLKTEFGRNQQIADILKSVFVEEMLHMTLATNVLNSIRGSINLDDETKLPTYPTIFVTGDGYQIIPNVVVSLEPFSIGLVDQVFSRIEQPADPQTQKIINHLGLIWEGMFGINSASVGGNMRALLDQIIASANVSTYNISGIHEMRAMKYADFGKSEWETLKTTADGVLTSLDDKNEKSVGGLYSMIALKLVSLESCAKLTQSATGHGTIFNGQHSRQINMSYWYQKSEDSVLSVMDSSNIHEKVSDSPKNTKIIKPPLFEVTDLKSALEAIVEIIYQGEGGSDYSPVVPETNVYASMRGRDRGRELSHYFRFREIVQGRKLVKTRYSTSPPDDCLKNYVTTTGSDKYQYCYVGEPIPFYSDGVWPMLSNPNAKDYVKGSKAHRLHEQFNLLYTRLLFCLQEAFNGKPAAMQKCMSVMYDLTITGKRLVQTPVRNPEHPQTEATGAPSWRLVREKWNRAGFPLRP